MKTAAVYSVRRKAVELATVAIQTAGLLATGLPTRRDEAEYARVKSICQVCEKFISDKQRCRVCGCRGGRPVLDLWLWQAKRCPLKKW